MALQSKTMLFFSIQFPMIKSNVKQEHKWKKKIKLINKIIKALGIIYMYILPSVWMPLCDENISMHLSSTMRRRFGQIQFLWGTTRVSFLFQKNMNQQMLNRIKSTLTVSGKWTGFFDNIFLFYIVLLSVMSQFIFS